MRYLIFSVLLALGLTACQRESSSDVNQDRIHTQYELYYNADEDITYARAWFRFGNATGTLLELAAPSQVTFDGEALAFNGFLAFYEKKFAGHRASGIFRWEDTEGKFYENVVSNRPIAIGALPNPVGRQAALTIPWTGDPLTAHELAGAWINGENEGDAQAAVTIETGAAALIVPANKMALIGAGPGKIYLERRSAPPLQQAPGAGGSGTGVYRAKVAEVVFE